MLHLSSTLLYEPLSPIYFTDKETEKKTQIVLYYTSTPHSPLTRTG